MHFLIIHQRVFFLSEIHFGNTSCCPLTVLLPMIQFDLVLLVTKMWYICLILNLSITQVKKHGNRKVKTINSDQLILRSVFLDKCICLDIPLTYIPKLSNFWKLRKYLFQFDDNCIKDDKQNKHSYISPA